MHNRTFFALISLLTAGVLQAQYAIADPPLNIRWAFALGPSTAVSSGRTVRLPVVGTCFSCPRISEVVSGADRGLFNAAIAATGVPNASGFSLRMEAMLNRNTSAPFVAPAMTCKALECSQPRKAESDEAWIFAGGIEFAPLDGRMVSPYVTVGGGMALNRLRWRQDSNTMSPLSGKAIALGPLAAAGGGIRAIFGTWAAFVEWRRFTTYVTAGSPMTPLSFGVQYRPNRTVVEEP